MPQGPLFLSLHSDIIVMVDWALKNQLSVSVSLSSTHTHTHTDYVSLTWNWLNQLNQRYRGLQLPPEYTDLFQRETDSKTQTAVAHGTPVTSVTSALDMRIGGRVSFHSHSATSPSAAITHPSRLICIIVDDRNRIRGNLQAYRHERLSFVTHAHDDSVTELVSGYSLDRSWHNL